MKRVPSKSTRAACAQQNFLRNASGRFALRLPPGGLGSRIARTLASSSATPLTARAAASALSACR